MSVEGGKRERKKEKENKDKADLRGKKEVKRMEPVMIVVVVTRRCDLAVLRLRIDGVALQIQLLGGKLRLKCGGVFLSPRFPLVNC